jgi:hypothetical protein
MPLPPNRARGLFTMFRFYLKIAAPEKMWPERQIRWSLDPPTNSQAIRGSVPRPQQSSKLTGISA